MCVFRQEGPKDRKLPFPLGYEKSSRAAYGTSDMSAQPNSEELSILIEWLDLAILQFLQANLVSTQIVRSFFL